eukprot:1295985-Pleurochrysis_carterae.AAC.1
MRRRMAEPAGMRTKTTASPPGWDGSHWRSRAASSCAPSAASTASRRNWRARPMSGTRCALMPSADATSVMTASYPRLAASARTRDSP